MKKIIGKAEHVQAAHRWANHTRSESDQVREPEPMRAVLYGGRLDGQELLLFDNVLRVPLAGCTCGKCCDIYRRTGSRLPDGGHVYFLDEDW